jgi:hypothetical protein
VLTTSNNYDNDNDDDDDNDNDDCIASVKIALGLQSTVNMCTYSSNVCKKTYSKHVK